MRTLVVYYSRSGTTQLVAERLARRLGADLELIGNRTRRTGRTGWLRCGFEAMRHRTCEIEPSTRDPAAYDLVVLGTPIWAGAVSTPVRSWIARHRAALTNVGFFCTCGGRGSERVFAELTRACGIAPRATLALHAIDLVRGVPVESIDVFATALGIAPAPPGSRPVAPSNGVHRHA